MSNELIEQGIRKPKIKFHDIKTLFRRFNATDVGLFRESDGYEYIVLIDRNGNPTLHIKVSKTCYQETIGEPFINEIDPHERLVQIVKNFGVIEEIETGQYKFGRVKLVENGFISWATGENLLYKKSTTAPIEIEGKVLNGSIITVHRI